MSNPTPAELGAGDIVIKLNGEEVTLKPSLEACIHLTTDPRGLFGGEDSIYGRIGKLDIGVMAKIIRLGLGIGASGVKDLEQRMFTTGLDTLRDPLWDFIGAIATGGRKMETDGEDGGAKAGGDPPPAASV
jgi:hypothetical protein